MSVDLEHHLGVTGTAEFRAQPAVYARAVCLQADLVDASRDGIDFAAQARDPEAVNDVRRRNAKLDRNARRCIWTTLTDRTSGSSVSG